MKKTRKAPIEMGKAEFKTIGHQLIDVLADFIEAIDEKPVTTGESPKQIQEILGTASLPEEGTDAAALLSNATTLLCNHSLLNGHPKFFGYITSSPAPLGALA